MTLLLENTNNYTYILLVELTLRLDSISALLPASAITTLGSPLLWSSFTQLFAPLNESFLVISYTGKIRMGDRWKGFVLDQVFVHTAVIDIPHLLSLLQPLCNTLERAIYNAPDQPCPIFQISLILCVLRVYTCVRVDSYLVIKVGNGLVLRPIEFIKSPVASGSVTVCVKNAAPIVGS